MHIDLGERPWTKAKRPGFWSWHRYLTFCLMIGDRQFLSFTLSFIEGYRLSVDNM